MTKLFKAFIVLFSASDTDFTLACYSLAPNNNLVQRF